MNATKKSVPNRQRRPNAAQIRDCLAQLDGIRPSKTRFGITVYGAVAFRGCPYVLWSWTGRKEVRVSAVCGTSPYRFRVNRVWVSLADVPERKLSAGGRINKA